MADIIKTPNTPYYDDFEKAKKFLRVLFRPSFAVQTRELNQLQTILNDQIASMADFFFKNGQKVIGGEVRVNARQAFIKLNTPLNRSLDSDYIGASVKNLTETLSAKIVSIVRAENGDPDTLYLEYEGTSTVDNVTQNFVLGENLQITFADSSIEACAVSSNAGSFGFGSLVSVRAGIYYILGQFVQTDEQTLVISKYAPVEEIDESTIGFEVVQKIVTSEDDISLLDNALGSPNETAPGAHRLVIDTILKKIDDVIDIQNFVRIVSLRGDEIVTEARNEGDFSVLEDILARRTFDESGDYVVDDFLLDVREHLNDGSNRGLFEPPIGDEAKLGLVLDSGKAYVRGYEVETSTNTILETDKARDTASQTSLLVDASYESAFTIKDLVNLPNSFQEIILREGMTQIGTASVRAVSYREQEAGDDIYRLDFFNPIITVADKTLSNVNNIAQTVTSFTANVTGLLLNPQRVRNFFPIPFGFIENVSALNFDYYREYVGTVNGTDLPITSAVNDQFLANADNYVVTIAGQVDRPVSVVRSSGNTQATLNVSNFGAVNGQTARVIAKTSRTGGIPRSKNLVEITETLVAGSTVTLGKVDVQSITSITNAGVDVTARYDLDGGQRDTHYAYGRLQLKAGFAVPVGNIEVTYKYFEHGSGDFFVAQSYENVLYKDIPFYTASNGDSVFLGSVIDFRPRANSATAFELSGAQSISAIDDLTSSFSYFLSRIDKVVVDRTGSFSVVRGTPAVNPVAPNDLDAAITLYRLNIPAFTFSTDDVGVERIDQRRFTMKDIGRLENRIQTLEYTSALNLLEVDAVQRELVDKFKSGFIVDNFRTYDVGDIEDAGHTISVDVASGEARPAPISDNIPLSLNAGASTGYVNNNGVITLPFTEVVEINQPLASRLERLQPYTVFNWIGNADLNPPADSWVSTQVLPNIVITNTINNQDWIFLGGRRRGILRVARRNTTSTTRTDSVTTNVALSPIPFIRSRNVAFAARGLKPNTKLKAYFDGVDVGQFVTPMGGVLGGDLVSSGAGTANGTFAIPNTNQVRFRTGIRKFVLSDGPLNADQANTYAEAFYTADGTLRTVQSTVVQTRTVNTTFFTRFVDPLAQSFAFEREGGGFITSIDLYFGPDAVDNDQPVTVELRGMTNGFPNPTVYASKTLDANQINGSADASVATRFTFDFPVYLEDGVEYCFVTLTNSVALTLWTAVLGDRARRTGDTGSNTGQVISKQPFIGSLFKSQNNSTWTPAQTEDIKFRINRANFNTGTVGQIVFNNVTPSGDIGTESDVYRQELAFDPYEFTSGSNLMLVRAENHGFRAGDVVTISGNQVGSMNGVPVAQIYGNRTVVSRTIDAFVVTIGANATSSGPNGGSGEVINKFVEFSSVYLNSENIVLNQTGLDFGFRAINRSTGVIDANWIPLNNRERTVLERTRVSTASGNNSVQLRATLRSSASNISPVIDATRMGFIATKNRIDNTPESLETNSGAACRYLQRSVSLVNPANEITVYADVNRPSGSSVQIFYKVGQTSTTEQEQWVEVPAFGAQPVSESFGEFKEYKWTVRIPGEFYAAKIKIVLRSDNEARFPRLKNLRALYLNV